MNNGFSRFLMYAALMTAGVAHAEGVVTKHVVKTDSVTSVTVEGSGDDVMNASADISGSSIAGHGSVGVAPTEAQAEEAFNSARKSYMAVASGGSDIKVSTTDVVSGSTEDHAAGGKSENIALENVHIVMDVDNVTLREVMAKIVQQAANYTGPWTVKWRLRPENAEILDERVNLTAEANFGEFCSLLTERVKNMTGTQLFVTAFAGTRVLLVADTYY